MEHHSSAGWAQEEVVRRFSPSYITTLEDFGDGNANGTSEETVRRGGDRGARIDTAHIEGGSCGRETQG